MSERFIYRTTEEERAFESTHFKPEETHARARKVLDEAEIKLSTFENLYSATMLKRDAAEVARREGIGGEDWSKIYGDILEAVVCEHGELSDWFGSRSQVMKMSRYDDLINKVDMVVEMEDEDQKFSHLALGIDVTFGSFDLHRKFDNIRAKIHSGDLGEIKYFHSDRQHFTGRLRRVPQVVAGVEKERVKELGLLWMNRRNSELAVHPVQVTILEECAEQLRAFAAYAASIGKTYTAALFERELQKIQELLAEKRRAGIKGLPHDKVFEEIRRNLQSFAEPLGKAA